MDIVIDIGSGFVYAGEAGLETPSLAGPARTGPGSASPVVRGRVADWAGYQALCQSVFDQLGAGPSTCRVLLAEPSASTKSDREQLTELMLARFGVAAFCLAAAAPLTMTATGRSTGVVIEADADRTTATPIVENYVMSSAVRAADLTGSDLLASLDRVAGLAVAAVSACDIDLRSEFYRAVVLSGAPTMAAGFPDRLTAQLQAKSPGAARVIVIAPDQRSTLAWTGGSILASLPVFDQQFITPDDYRAGGPAIVQRYPN